MTDMGLSIAASGLAADTAELDTASNNLSNINTPGYAAEHVNLSPEGAVWARVSSSAR
jgi:flagellar basal body rod protein FlgG